MESSIAEFLLRQSACERLPTIREEVDKTVLEKACCSFYFADLAVSSWRIHFGKSMSGLHLQSLLRWQLGANSAIACQCRGRCVARSRFCRFGPSL